MINREETLRKAREASEAELARIDAEVRRTIVAEIEQADKGEERIFEYVPDGERAGSERRNRTRSGRWLLDLE